MYFTIEIRDNKWYNLISNFILEVFMNKKGFTLVELLATLVILAVIIGIVLISSTGGFSNAKDKTEEVFVKTIKDALEIYIDSDGRNLNFNNQVCTINKNIPGTDDYRTVKVYKTNKDKNGNTLTFNNVINSSYHPISESDMHNPANKGKDKYQCSTNGTLNIYRDEDYVYYYKIEKSSFGCFNKTGSINNLPSGCDN